MDIKNMEPNMTSNENNIKMENAPSTELEEDELIQDWSSLAKLSKNSALKTLPKRGEKEYEPDGTIVQEEMLLQARKAMFNTLFNSIRGSMTKNQTKAFFVPKLHKAFIIHAKGNFLQTVGKVDKEGRCWLTFFEFLYFSERGTVSPFVYQVESDPMPIDDRPEEIPLSIQDIYSYFKSQTEMNEFSVYAYLKRLGYIVTLVKSPEVHPTSFFPTRNVNNIFYQFRNTFSIVKDIIHNGVRSILRGVFFSKGNFKIIKYLSNSMIYKGLQCLVDHSNVPKSKDELLKVKANILDNRFELNPIPKISFKVWKPQTNYKKKSPGLSDYEVLVIDKNDHSQHFPTMRELEYIFNSLDYKFDFLAGADDASFWDNNSFTNGIPRQEYLTRSNYKVKQVKSSLNSTKMKKNKKPINSYKPQAQQAIRLKNGYRSLLIAILDNGIISFVKISEADFGVENVWYVPHINGFKNKT